MSLTFADTHNMVACLNKSDASKGFNQVIDFLNGSYINYALTVNPNIYVSCIKQFWNTIVVKQTNDVTRLQALVDRKKVVITKAATRDVLRLNDVEGVDCMPNEEIFAELARMGYEKPSTKITFYKAFFSSHLMRNVDNTKLKRRVKKLEKGNRVKVLKLRRLKKVRMIDDLDKDDVVALMDDKEEEKKEEEVKDDQVQGRQAKIYKIDKPAEVQEVVDVVTTAKLITKVVTASSETVTAASTTIFAVEPQVSDAATTTAASVRVATTSTRRRKGVVIRDPEEESTTIIPADTKSKDKGKGIMVEEPKPLKKKQQVKMDEEYTRKLHEELNKDIDWDVAIEYVKQKAKEDPAPNNFFDDFLLTNLGAMFERPDGQAQVSKNQRTVHGQAKVKSWKLLESCGVHIITLTTTHLILLVERRYLLSRFTLDQMPNAVRLKVEEQSEMSLELL
nr:hypothetical protein [Tanacetum cinerariifolium]